MNINNINSFSSVIPFADRFQSQGQEVPTVQQEGDVVSVRPAARLLEDDEWEGVLADSVSMIGANPMEAMQAHSGLDAARVAALLA